MANILANSINDKEHLKAFDDLVAQRFSEIDLSILIPNLFDTVPVDALPYLAKQYNLLGYNGWRYADTEQKQRDLLKNWHSVKKYKGTMHGITEALKMIDITPIDINVDPYDFYPDGIEYCNGHYACGGPNPFNFEIVIFSDDIPIITEQMVIDMFAIIKEFKAARDLLIAVHVATGETEEELTVEDELHIVVTGPGGGTYDI